MIGKVLQEIEKSTGDKEKRADIRRKKRQVRKFFLSNGLIWREPKRPWHTTSGSRDERATKVEGRALRRKTCSTVCQFLLEEVFCKCGCVGQVIADRGELDSDKAREFFTKHGVRLTLTTAYNPEANEKIERGQSTCKIMRRKGEGLAADASICTMGGSHDA